MKGIMAMYDYKWKKGGLTISLGGLVGMVLEKTIGIIIVPKLTAAQHYGIFEWIMFFGLLIIMYSKEKHEDERAKLIRLKSLQVAFMLTMAVLMGMAFTLTLHPDTLGPQELFMIGGMGIVLYLMLFHIGLYFDFLWEYDDKGVWDNLRNLEKNKWSLIVYLIISTLILLLLTFL